MAFIYQRNGIWYLWRTDVIGPICWLVLALVVGAFLVAGVQALVGWLW